MKITTFSFQLCVSLVITIIYSCEKPAKEMVIATGEVSDISYNSASVSGQLIDIGDGGNQYYGHYYWNDNSYSRLSTTFFDVTGTSIYTSELTDLEAGTTYHVQAYLRDVDEDVYVFGKEISFNTPGPDLPAVSTLAVTSIYPHTGTSGGIVSNTGGVQITEVGICWNILPNPTIANYHSPQYIGPDTGSFTCNLTGLTANAKYYVRAYATNSVGTAYGKEVIFITCFEIGEYFQGGKIAYYLQPSDMGFDPNVPHGLIAAEYDQSGGVIWFNRNNEYTSTGAAGAALGTGNANTNIIVTIQGDEEYAAKICYDLDINGYSDWYLPSIDELNQISYSWRSIGGFEADYYWSSTEVDHIFAKVKYVLWGGTITNDKDKSSSYRVRAVRSF